MRTLSLKRSSVPKVAVLAAGLVAAFLVATVNPAPLAQAFPSKQQDCTNCHGVGTPAGTVNAVPSTTTPAAGAPYTVLITAPANADEPAGETGYWIANSTAAGVTGTSTGVYGGNDGSVALTRTATMTAPAASGTYYYKVWADKGSTSSTGVTNFKVYSITVAGAPVVVTTTTALAVTPASPVVAPASPTLKATISGAGAAGTVEFFNGTTSLGAPTASAAGVASKTLSAIPAGSYSYTAKFVPTNAAAFTSSTSTAVAYLVAVPVPTVVTTTTALAVTPASPVVAPASPTLKATVTGAGAAGLVEFFNGTTSLGTSPVAAGIATKALTGVAAGSYSYKAVFTPTNVALFTPSTSLVVAYVVTVAPPTVITTATALAVTPASPVVAPASPSLKATVTGAGAAGLVEFFNGTTSLGASPVAAGIATKALTGVAAGSYSYKAVFTPTDATLFTSSTSLVVAYVVTAAPPVVITTTTALAVSPATAVAPGSATLTATVTPAGAVGTVEFFNGTISLGIPSAITGGVAAKALVALGAGSYSYTAKFIPTNVANFTTSTSSAATFVVTAPAAVITATALAVSPVTAVAPANATLTATVTPAGAVGTVEFFNGTISLGIPSAITGGVATKALVALGAGSYSYTAKFIPANVALFTSSTSSPATFVVTPAPVAVPVASFTASATSGDFPLPVTFTDTSTNTPTSWAWDLGNGTTSIVQNPSVSYTAAGTYTVTLIASNATGTSAMVTQTITVTTPAPVVIAPVISALAPANGAIGDTVTITGTGFGTVGTVQFGTAVLDYTSTDGLSIAVVAPDGVRRAKVTVTPTDGDSAGTASNRVIFKYNRIPRVK